MNEEKTFAQKVIQFDENLSNISIELPEGFKIINPFNGDKKETVRKISTSFYKRFYNDRNNRRLILGSSPARRGTAVTGVPFEDALHLQKETGIKGINLFMPIRIAVSGEMHGPELPETIFLLGREKSIKHIDQVLATL